MSDDQSDGEDYINSMLGIFNWVAAEILGCVLFFGGLIVIVYLWAVVKIPFKLAAGIVIGAVFIPLIVYDYISKRRKLAIKTKVLLGVMYLAVVALIPFLILQQDWDKNKPQSVKGKSADITIEVNGITDLLSYLADKDDFKDCKRGGLMSLKKAVKLDSKTEKQISLETSKFSPSELYDAGANYVENGDERIGMYLIYKSAQQENTYAMNEVGASLLYCYRKIEQDIPKAQYWLDKAAINGDNFAKLSLGKIYLNDLAGLGNVELGTKLIKKCAKARIKECRKIKKKIKKYR